MDRVSSDHKSDVKTDQIANFNWHCAVARNADCIQPVLWEDTAEWKLKKAKKAKKLTLGSFPPS